jgi:hypothetical protein
MGDCLIEEEEMRAGYLIEEGKRWGQITSFQLCELPALKESFRSQQSLK